VAGSTAEPDSGYPRLETQIKWYDRSANRAQFRYKLVKILEVGSAALIPFISYISPAATAFLGSAVIVLEALQQINQWHRNWITYRSTCENLIHEKYLFLGCAGSYIGLEGAAAMQALVDRVEMLISAEHGRWVSRQEATPRGQPGRLNVGDSATADHHAGH
jgi:hypothetical protein